MVKRQQNLAEIGINKRPYTNAPINYSQLGRINFRYRGQPIEEWRIRFTLLSFQVNLLDDEADKILTLNRNNFRAGTAKDELFNRVSKAVQEFFEGDDGKKYYLGLAETADKAVIAAEYELQGWNRPKYFDVGWDELWISVLTSQDWKDIELKTLADYKTIILPSDIETEEQDQQGNEPSGELPAEYDNPSSVMLSILGLCDSNHRSGIKSVYFLVSRFLKEQGFYPVYPDGSSYFVALTKTKKSPISNESIRKYCKNLRKSKSDAQPVWLKRESIPVPFNHEIPDLSKLELRDNDEFTIGKNSLPLKRAFELDLISPRMLFPLALINGKITVGDPGILAKRVHNNLKDPNVKEAEVKEKYQEFIAFLDKLMKDDPDWVERRGSEFIKPADQNPSNSAD